MNNSVCIVWLEENRAACVCVQTCVGEVSCGEKRLSMLGRQRFLRTRVEFTPPLKSLL